MTFPVIIASILDEKSRGLSAGSGRVPDQTDRARRPAGCAAPGARVLPGTTPGRWSS